MNLSKKTARLAGLLWFFSTLTGAFGLLYIRSNVIVPGDAAATAGNIMTSEFLYRAAIVSSLFSQIFLFFLGLTLFHLFKEVNKQLPTVRDRGYSKYSGHRIISHLACSLSDPDSSRRSLVFC